MKRFCALTITLVLLLTAFMPQASAASCRVYIKGQEVVNNTVDKNIIDLKDGTTYFNIGLTREEADFHDSGRFLTKLGTTGYAINNKDRVDESLIRRWSQVARYVYYDNGTRAGHPQVAHQMYNADKCLTGYATSIGQAEKAIIKSYKVATSFPLADINPVSEQGMKPYLKPSETYSSEQDVLYAFVPTPLSYYITNPSGVGVILHNIKIVPILDDDIGSRSADTCVPRGGFTTSHSTSDGFINDSGSELSLKKTLSNSIKHTVMGEIAGSKAYSKSESLKVSVGIELGLKGYFEFNASYEGGMSIVNSFTDSWKTGEETTKQSTTTTEVSTTLKPYSGVLLTTESGEKTFTLDFDCPTMITYDATIIQYGKKSTVLTQYSGVNGAVADLVRRSGKGYSIADSDGICYRDYTAWLAKQLAIATPVSMAGGRITYSRNGSQFVSDATLPTRPIYSIESAAEYDEDIILSPGSSYYLTSVTKKLAAYNELNAPYIGFNYNMGYWVLIDKDGREIESSDVIDVFYREDTKKWQVKAKDLGEAAVRYKINDGVYSTVNYMQLPKPKYITNSDIEIPMTLNFVVEAGKNAPGDLIIEGLPTLADVGGEAIDLNDIEGLRKLFRNELTGEVDVLMYDVGWELQETTGATLEDGVLSFQKPGTYHIRGVYDEDTTSEWYTIKAVKAANIKSLAITPDAVTLGEGETLLLKLTRKPKKNKDEVVFESSDPAIVQVDENGLVRAVAIGKAAVTARALNGVTASCEITVAQEPKSLTVLSDKLIDGKLALEAKQKATLRTVLLPEDAGAGITFESSAPKVVKVDTRGNVTALKKGEAIITASTYNALKQEIAVVVTPGPKKIKLSEKKVSLMPGASYMLEATNGSGAPCSCTFKSNKPEIAIVDPDSGLITGVKPGRAKITVKSANGKKAVCSVTVFEITKESPE